MECLPYGLQEGGGSEPRQPYLRTGQATAEVCATDTGLIKERKYRALHPARAVTGGEPGPAK